MKLAVGIRKLGFRKWYERELLQGHAHLVLCFLCFIGLFAAFEGSSRSLPLGEQLVDAATIVLFTVTGAWALRRYLFLLGHAEAVANQADCPQCSTHGRLDLLQASASGDRVQVKCRQCGHAWDIFDE
jgi:predicted Zn finger-like uncharacterized protein